MILLFLLIAEEVNFIDLSTEKENEGTYLENTNEEVSIIPAAKPPQTDQEPKVVIKTHLISRQSFEYISKTLAGLMEMDSIQKKLIHKNVLVKLVMKTYDTQSAAYKRSISYLFGYMKTVFDQNYDGEKWVFALAEDDDLKNTQSESWEKEKSPYTDTTSLTLIITTDKFGKKLTRINLNPRNAANKCKICDKIFKSPLHLKRHQNNSHTNKNGTENKPVHWFTCNICKRQFNTQSSLKRHMSVHNPNLRPLQCTLCLQRFTDQSSLKRHLLIHTGIKAYQCGVCSKSFKHIGDLNNHHRTHDQVKQYVCDVCGREFSRHCNLQRHVEIHKGDGALYR